MLENGRYEVFGNNTEGKFAANITEITEEKIMGGNGDRICNTCCKEDVCMIKGELAHAAKEISKIEQRTNIFIDTDIKCKKWLPIPTKPTLP